VALQAGCCAQVHPTAQPCSKLERTYQLAATCLCMREQSRLTCNYKKLPCKGSRLWAQHVLFVVSLYLSYSVLLAALSCMTVLHAALGQGISCCWEEKTGRRAAAGKGGKGACWRVVGQTGKLCPRFEIIPLWRPCHCEGIWCKCSTWTLQQSKLHIWEAARQPSSSVQLQTLTEGRDGHKGHALSRSARPGLQLYCLCTQCNRSSTSNVSSHLKSPSLVALRQHSYKAQRHTKRHQQGCCCCCC